MTLSQTEDGLFDPGEDRFSLWSWKRRNGLRDKDGSTVRLQLVKPTNSWSCSGRSVSGGCYFMRQKTNLPVSFLGGFSSRRYQMIWETVEVRRLVFVRVTLCFCVLLPKSQAIVSSTPLDSFWPESNLHRRVSALRWRTEAAEEHSWDHYSLGLRCLVCRFAWFSPVHAVSYLCCVTVM